MSTEIVFVGGQRFEVAEPIEAVIAARASHPHPVALESTIGTRIFVNWEHVAYVLEGTPGQVESAPNMLRSSARM